MSVVGNGRATGTVRFWNEAKGYGFITLDPRSVVAADVFLACWALPKKVTEPQRGDRLEFDLCSDKKEANKYRAKNIKLMLR